MWNILDTGVRSAESNMRLDETLLESLDPKGLPILHFYDWLGPSATYGHFIKVADFLDLKEAQSLNLNLGKRPTGGGIVFHVSDLAFSVLVPSAHPCYSLNTLDNYSFVNNIVLRAVEEFLKKNHLHLLEKEPTAYAPNCFHFCMAKPTIYDVMLGGKKVAGAAQRRRKQGFLHQGSISIALPSIHFLEKVLLPDSSILAAMKSITWTILPDGWKEKELQEVRVALKKQLEIEFQRT